MWHFCEEKGFITRLFLPSSGVGEQKLIVPSEVKCPCRRVECLAFSGHTRGYPPVTGETPDERRRLCGTSMRKRGL